MKINDSELKNQIIKSFNTKIGDFYLFENLIVSEIKEGVHICYDVLEDFFPYVIKHYGDKPFAYISNRINSYSVSALDFDEYKKTLKNLTFYGIVNYSKFSEAFLKVEERFCTVDFKVFTSLIEAYDDVNQFQIKTKANLIQES